MRKGWEYKTFGEVGSFLRGKSIQKADFVENGMPCIHYGQIHTKFGVSVDRHLSEIPLDLYNKSIIASHGDVIIAITSEDLEGSCKSTAWLGNYDIAVSSHAAVYKHTLNPKFIAYYLRSKSFYYEKQKYARGFKVMEIKPTDIEKIPIPIPPHAEQERVVSELELLSGIIEKKKAQLKEYDQFTQSIFYDMFGDPVTNEKGWEVKKLGEVCETTSGGTPSKKHPEYYEGGTTPWLRSGEVCQGFIYHTELFITEEGLKCSSAKMVPVNSVAIAMYGATCGQVGIIKSPMCTNQAVCCIFPNNTFIPIFLYFFLLSKKSEYLKVAVGGAQPNISQSVIKQTLISIPPLSLQQSFASKIEAIEKQKELIKQSIIETETLFNSRMDYYFNDNKE